MCVMCLCMFSLFVVSHWMLIILDVRLCVCVCVLHEINVHVQWLAYIVDMRHTMQWMSVSVFVCVCVRCVCFDQCHQNRLSPPSKRGLMKKTNNFMTFPLGAQQRRMLYCGKWLTFGGSRLHTIRKPHTRFIRISSFRLFLDNNFYVRLFSWDSLIRLFARPFLFCPSKNLFSIK